MALTPDNRVPGSHAPTPLTPDFEAVQAHYDLSNAFFATFLDPTRMYSCAFFLEGNETLQEAQVAKVDYTLGKLNLQSGQRLLDVGSGWGYTLRRANDNYGVSGVGLTLSENQAEYSQQQAEGSDGIEYRLEGWEIHSGSYDAIVSIGAFEHFGRKNYPAFFEKAREFLPEGGRMLLHTIRFNQAPPDNERLAFGRYARFIGKEIFPHGELPYPDHVPTLSREAGFTLVGQEDRGLDYATTLDMWAKNLLENRDAAVAAVNEKNSGKGEEIHKIYMKYLTESADWFRKGVITVSQYLLEAPRPEKVVFSAS